MRKFSLLLVAAILIASVAAASSGQELFNPDEGHWIVDGTCQPGTYYLVILVNGYPMANSFPLDKDMLKTFPAELVSLLNQSPVTLPEEIVLMKLNEDSYDWNEVKLPCKYVRFTI